MNAMTPKGVREPFTWSRGCLNQQARTDTNYNLMCLILATSRPKLENKMEFSIAAKRFQ